VSGSLSLPELVSISLCDGDVDDDVDDAFVVASSRAGKSSSRSNVCFVDDVDDDDVDDVVVDVAVVDTSNIAICVIFSPPVFSWKTSTSN